MSQTLALIVAASVLMMTALTVIFLAQGALGDFGEDSAVTSCEQSVRAQCQAALSTTTETEKTIETPATCVDSDTGTTVVNEVAGAASSIGPDETTCVEE